MNVLKVNELEELLVANWTKFIDSHVLMSYVLQQVQANSQKFATISDSCKLKGVTVTLSRCHWHAKGFLVWVEFHVPLSHYQMAEGTMELNLSPNGSLTHLNTCGNIYSNK